MTQREGTGSMRPTKLHPKVKRIIRHTHHSARVIFVAGCIDYVASKAIAVIQIILVQIGSSLP